MRRVGFAVGIGLVMVGSVFAVDSAEKPPAGRPPMGMMGHRGPPPEALEACKGKKADDACEFSPPTPPKDAPKAKARAEAKGDRKISGKCWAPESSKPLACRPNGGHPIPEPKDDAGGPPSH
ncbi:MAG: hypothetical protein JST04_16355 [Bdellovibrionales bacterium]|nr:hypothetical protein [Bdellovibrionales bacterium]